MRNLSWIIFALVAVCVLDLNVAFNRVPPEEWAEYKAKFNKTYRNMDSEGSAEDYYANNKKRINLHNLHYDAGTTTFRLAINQYSDNHFLLFNAGFLSANSRGPSFDTPPPAVQAAAPSYNPITDSGFLPNIENQGTVCNSGWAYSAAKAVEMLKTKQTGNMTPLSLSAQNFIDCAARVGICINQVPQTAFDYLTRLNMGLHLASDYPNNNASKEQGKCTAHGTLVTNLGKYSRLRDGDDDALMAYVSNGYAIVVEMVPCSFEFMHYSSGIYQQTPRVLHCSHFVLLLGYGTDATTGMNYWLVQNSFGTFWGENGLMRVERTPSKRVFKNAIFPSELA